MSIAPSPGLAARPDEGFLLLELLHLGGWAIAVTGVEQAAPKERFVPLNEWVERGAEALLDGPEENDVVIVAKRHPFTIRMTGPTIADCALPVYVAALALRRAATG